MSKASRWLILLTISGALALIVIDMTVLYTALPSLTTELAATPSEKLWIVMVYGLVVAGLLPSFGTLGDRVGHKRIFVAGLVVFGVASLVAAYAPTPVVLIIARVLLAIGAAAMMPATLSIIRVTFVDGRERAVAIGIWGAVASSGAAVGPLVGGVLLEYFWWGSVFLINVPLVAAALVAALVLLPAPERKAVQGWDMVSSIQIMAGLVGFALAVEKLGSADPPYGVIAALAVGAAIVLILFARRQLKLETPLIDLTLFRNRPFALGVVTAIVASSAIAGSQLGITQRLQLMVGYSPLETAMYILPAPAAAFVGGPLAGLVLHRLGVVRTMRWALFLAGISVAGYFACYTKGLALQLTCLALLGLGLGAAMAAASNAIMNQAPPGREGMAASIEEVSFELGGTVGISIFGSILAGVYTRFMVLPSDPAVPTAVRDSIDEALAIARHLPADIATTVTAQAHRAFDQAFATVIVVAAIFLLVASALMRSAARPIHATKTSAEHS